MFLKNENFFKLGTLSASFSDLSIFLSANRLYFNLNMAQRCLQFIFRYIVFRISAHWQHNHCCPSSILLTFRDQLFSEFTHISVVAPSLGSWWNESLSNWFHSFLRDLRPQYCDLSSVSSPMTCPVLNICMLITSIFTYLFGTKMFKHQSGFCLLTLNMLGAGQRYWVGVECQKN